MYLIFAFNVKVVKLKSISAFAVPLNENVPSPLFVKTTPFANVCVDGRLALLINWFATIVLPCFSLSNPNAPVVTIAVLLSVPVPCAINGLLCSAPLSSLYGAKLSATPTVIVG